jgi:hypothetical protein
MSFAAFTKAIDLQNSLQLLKVARSKGMFGGMLGAYFRGANMAKVGTAMAEGGLKGMRGVTGDFGTAAARVGGAIGVGMMASAVVPRNDFTGGMGALAGYGAAYGAMGMIPNLPKGAGGGALRTIGGLVGGSIGWQGLRGSRMSDFG